MQDKLEQTTKIPKWARSNCKNVKSFTKRFRSNQKNGELLRR